MDTGQESKRSVSGGKVQAVYPGLPWNMIFLFRKTVSLSSAYVTVYLYLKIVHSTPEDS